MQTPRAPPTHTVSLDSTFVFAATQILHNEPTIFETCIATTCSVLCRSLGLAKAAMVELASRACAGRGGEAGGGLLSRQIP